MPSDLFKSHDYILVAADPEGWSRNSSFNFSDFDVIRKALGPAVARAEKETSAMVAVKRPDLSDNSRTAGRCRSLVA